MATAPSPLTHAVQGNLEKQCRQVLSAALNSDARFSISDPKYDRLHVAVYQLYLLGYIARTGGGFSDWKLTERGIQEAHAQQVRASLPKPLGDGSAPHLERFNAHAPPFLGDDVLTSSKSASA